MVGRSAAYRCAVRACFGPELTSWLKSVADVTTRELSDRVSELIWQTKSYDFAADTENATGKPSLSFRAVRQTVHRRLFPASSAIRHWTQVNV
jgi:hypothetical protein